MATKAARKPSPAKLLDTAVSQPTKENIEAALEGVGLDKVNEAGLLFLACKIGEGALPLVERLLAAGADPNAPAMPRWWGRRPLQGIFEAWDVPESEARAVTERLLAAGADPNLADSEGGTPLACALVAASPLVDVLWERSGRPARVGGVIAAIAAVGEVGRNGLTAEGLQRQLERVRAVLGKLDDVDEAAPSGLTPLTQIVVSAKPQLIDAVLSRSAQPNPLDRELCLDVRQAVPANGGMQPQLRLPAGLTARGVGQRLHEMVAQEAARDGKKTGPIVEARRSYLEALTEVLGVLAARNIPEGEGADQEQLPSFLSPIRDALRAAALASGAEPTQVQRALATVPWSSLGPLEYLLAAANRLDGMLAFRADPPGLGRWFVELCAGRDIELLDDEVDGDERAGVTWVDPRDYSASGQKLLRKGVVLARAEDSLLVGVKTGDASWRRDGSLERPAAVKLVEVRPDGTKELGRDLAAFLRAAAKDCGLS